jgi:hypothetical protein
MQEQLDKCRDHDAKSVRKLEKANEKYVAYPGETAQ